MRNRNTDIENRVVGAAEEGEGEMNWEPHRHIHPTACEIESWWELLHDLGTSSRCSVTTWGVGWGAGRGRLKREGTCVYSWLIHGVVQQKPTQHCNAIILQLRKKKQSAQLDNMVSCSIDTREMMSKWGFPKKNLTWGRIWIWCKEMEHVAKEGKEDEKAGRGSSLGHGDTWGERKNWN